MQPQHTATVRDAGRDHVQLRELDREQHSSYHDRRRWSTPARRRTDVYVVELSRPASSPADDCLLLSA